MAMISTPKKILVINLTYIGDVVIKTPLIRALKMKYPDAVIDLFVIPLTKDLAEATPYVNEVLIYDKRGSHKKLKNLWELIKTVRARQYDLAICTNFSPRGAWFTFLARIPQRIGYDIQHAKWFLTHTTPARHGKQYRLRTEKENLIIRHETENQLDILEILGISTNDTRMEINIDPGWIQAMQTKLNLASNHNRPITVICPLGSQEKKSWTVSGTANFIKNISSIADCYLIGSESQAALLNKINATAGNLAKVLAGTLSLGELAAFISFANLLVSVDTGPVHIAEAVKTPVIALFGPHDPRIWGPRGPKSKIFTLELACSPCWEKCENNRCMQEIDETAVISVAASMLENTLM